MQLAVKEMPNLDWLVGGSFGSLITVTWREQDYFIGSKKWRLSFLFIFSVLHSRTAPTTLCKMAQVPLKFYQFVFFLATKVASLSFCFILSSVHVWFHACVCVCVALTRHSCTNGDWALVVPECLGVVPVLFFLFLVFDLLCYTLWFKVCGRHAQLV